MTTVSFKPVAEIDLCGQWQFRPDPHDDGEKLKFWNSDYPGRDWGQVDIPSVADHAVPALAGYEGITWFRRRFRAPDDLRGKRVALRFEAVNYIARVWLDGRFLGENRDGFLPFEFEIGDLLRPGHDGMLTVSVDNAPHAGDVPGDQVQWLGAGGILREVTLVICDRLHVQDTLIQAVPALNGQSANVAVVVQIKNARPETAAASVVIDIRDPGGQTVLSLTAAASIPAGETVILRTADDLDPAQPWTPDSPALYTAVVRLGDTDGPLNETAVRFGFRHIEADPEGLRLNGHPLFLTGFNRHEDSPRTGAAMDHETTAKDLKRIKQAGANFVRLCHYPHHPAELAMCDEIGLLVLAEIPLNLEVDEARAVSAERQLCKMIRRDRNHPCVIFWSVGNETKEEHPFAAETNRKLIRLAKRLDTSRLCVHVSFRWAEHPNFAADDVICINNYPSIESWQGRCGRDPSHDLSASPERWRVALQQLHAQYPGKPILITEFGYPAIAGTAGHALGEDMQDLVVRTEFPAFDLPYLCGVSLWCWADHPWPPGHKFQKLVVSPFGVNSRSRKPKQVLKTIRSLFHATQKADHTQVHRNDVGAS